MSTLPDNEVITIAKTVATSNGVSFRDVRTAPVFDSTGAPAMEIKFVLTPGSSAHIMGQRSANTIIQIMQKLADAGEDRFPIVQYEE
ncbi:hypothetical protein [Bradyrhizobium sp. LTSP849]|uniref:hypothetical protein n=1 Tax=Bradyrhizobium sp. LTSP849 TaxID=1615890 RepID=UPI0012E061FF|nr:hypothetical protein [Bradyrhizobium sp. LTSP849]